MSTYLTYYLQTNIVCILFCLYILVSNRIGKKDLPVDARLLEKFVFEVLLYCVVDMLAAVFKGKTFAGAREILYLSNMIYIAIPALVAWTWWRYIFVRMEPYGYEMRKAENILPAVNILSAILIFTTPFTNYAFTLDEQNIYHRGRGAYVIPVLFLGTVLYVSIKVFRTAKRSDSPEAKERGLIVVLFLTPILLATFVQVLNYGVTIAQVGLTTAALMVHMNNLRNQVSKDELTGLNNRKEYERYVHSLCQNKENLLICMIDLDKFKEINDRFGHLEGDRALRRAGFCISRVFKEIKEPGFVARYGGDEFVIVCRNATKESAEMLKKQLEKSIELDNRKEDSFVKISMSIGCVTGTVSNKEEYLELLKQADDKMYANKAIHHAG